MAVDCAASQPDTLSVARFGVPLSGWTRARHEGNAVVAALVYISRLLASSALLPASPERAVLPRFGA